jgi:PAS domain S-box-containing protein
MVFHDITERKRAEHEVQSLAKFPLENPSAVMRVDRNGTIIYCNPAGQPLLQQWKCEVCGHVPDRISKITSDALTSDKKIEFEETYGKQTFSFLFVPIVKEGYVNIYGVDTTERKAADIKLEQAKHDWERTFDSIPDLIAILDKQHRIVRANKAMAQGLGTTPERCIGLNCYECVHGTSMPLEFCPHEQTLKDGKEHVAEVQEPRLGGSFLVSTTPLKNEQGQLIGSVHVARDITERKKAEDVVRSTLERYRSFIEVTGELGWITNGSGEVAEDIPSFRKYTGQTYEEVKGWGWLKALHPDDVERTKQVWKEATATRNRYETSYRLRRHDGIYRYFMARSVPAFNEDGTVREWVGTCIDITDRKEREQELRDTLEASHRRQAEVSALLNASKAVLKHREFAKSSQLIFESCKELLGATAGYVALLSKDGKENEALFLNSGGLPCTVNPSLPMPIRGLRAQAYAKGKVVYDNDFSKSEWAKLMPTGHVTLANVLFAPLIIENKTVGIIGLANKHGGFTERDAEMALAFGEISSVALINSQLLETLEAIIEERTQKLKASERLATIGETAGMVGHDIRNPLQAIIGEIYLAKDELTTVPESGTKQSLRETLAMIEEQIGYINKIVTDLQDFAKPLLPCLEETNLQTILQSTLPMINIPETVEVSLVLQEELPNFKSDTGYIKRVITNLISNAVQAMPKGGKLTVKTHRENGSAVLIVEDTGVGIPESARPKLFQPLFTTKSKGQGFGLAVCKRLIDAMGGTITFDSEEGKGTKFTVKLPINQ